MTVQIPLKKINWVFHTGTMIFGHLCRGRRIQLSGHSDFGIFNNLWASSIWTWVQPDIASAACPSQPSNLEMISMILAAVIWDAEDPCSLAISPLRSATRPLYFWCFASNSVFFTKEIRDSNMVLWLSTVFFSFHIVFEWAAQICMIQERFCSHEHSPQCPMFSAIFCIIWHSFLSNSHLVPDFIDKFCCVTSQWTFQNEPFLGDSLTQVALINRESLFVPYGMRISVEQRFFRMRVNFPQWIPRILLRLPWSIVPSISSFPHLRKPRWTTIFWMVGLDVSTGFPTVSSRTGCSGSWCPYEGILAVVSSWVLDLVVTRSSSDLLLSSFCLCSGASCKAEMAKVQQIQQMILFITNEIPFEEDVCVFVCGVNVVDLHFGVPINSIEQPIKNNSVSSGNVSHCGISVFHNHFDHSLIDFKHMQQNFLTCGLNIWKN